MRKNSISLPSGRIGYGVSETPVVPVLMYPCICGIVYMHKKAPLLDVCLGHNDFGVLSRCAAMATPTEETIIHLNQTYGNLYLLWNLSNEKLDSRLQRGLRMQICDFEWRAPGKSQSPNMVSLLRICYSVKVGLLFHPFQTDI